MTEREFNRILGERFPGQEGKEFTSIIDRMVDMLDETDGDDYFGTEGWRRAFGWED